MTSVLLELLPVARRALTPTAVLAVILLLFSPGHAAMASRSWPGGTLDSFILSWVIVAFLARLGFFSSLLAGTHSRPDSWWCWGCCFSFSPFSSGVPVRGQGPRSPSRHGSTRLNTLRPGHSFGIGAALASITPKMILLTLAAAVIIGQTSTIPRHSIAADFFYATLASIPIAIPVGVVPHPGRGAPGPPSCAGRIGCCATTTP